MLDYSEYLDGLFEEEALPTDFRDDDDEAVT